MTTTANLVRSSADPRKTVTLAAAAAMLCGLAGAVAPPASADGCPDVELVFARGTGEPPGVGRVGQALIDTLTPMLGGRSLAVYPVNYPASINFLTTGSGATDAENHLAAAAVACPATQFVLGGFSQGASVISMMAGVPPLGNTVGNLGSAPPMPPEAADQIAAVAVFGNPANRFGTPLSTTGLFAGRAIDVCNPGDPICVSGGRDRAARHHHAARAPGAGGVGRGRSVAMHQAHAVALHIKARTGRYCGMNSVFKKRCVNALLFVKAPHARPDLGARAERSPAQKLPLCRIDPHGFAAVRTAFGNGGLKNPRMAAQ
jgi:cutinase